MESIYNILNTVFPNHVLTRQEYRVAVKVIKYFNPDTQIVEMDGSRLKPIANLIELNAVVLKEHYGVEFKDVFDNNRSQHYNKFRMMCYCASIDALGLDRYTVQRSFTNYRSRCAVYVGIEKFRYDLEKDPTLRSEYDKYKILLKMEYERRIKSTPDSDLDIYSDSTN